MGERGYSSPSIIPRYSELLKWWGEHQFEKGLRTTNESLLFKRSGCMNERIALFYYILRVLKAKDFDDFKKSIGDLVSKYICANNCFLAFFTNPICYGLHMYFNI